MNRLYRNISKYILPILVSAAIINTADIVSYAATSSTTGAPSVTTPATTSTTPTSTSIEKELAPEGGLDNGMQVVSKGLKADPVTNDITYTTVDKQRTSNTYYTTRGFTISDAYVDSNGNLVETGYGEINVFLNGLDGIATANPKQQISGTVSTSSWTISYDALLAAIKEQAPAWYERLTTNKDGKSVALKLDAIIGFHVNGEILTDENGFEVYADKYNLAEFKAKFPWFSKYADNHYNKGLVKYYAQMVDEGLMTEEEAHKILDSTKMIGKEEPDYWTFNWNPKGQFDLGDGIPTSEDVRNGYQADQWFGYALIGKREGAYHTWNFGGSVTWDETYTYTAYDDVTMEPYEDTVTYSVSKDYTYGVTRKVDYWFMSSAAFWDLDTVKDENTVYPSGAHNFTSKIDVPMTCTINGTDLTSSASYESAPNDDWHVNWAGAVLLDNYTIHTDASSKDSAIAAFKEEAESRIKKSDEIEVRNDQLTINGKTYMTSEWHEYKNGENAKEVGQKYAYSNIGASDYGIDRQDTGETGNNERIPSTVKNKEYTTTITVNYKQKITPSGQTSRSKSGVGAILSEAVPTGIGKDFPSQEPIKVHTPVISPVIFLNPSTGNQLDIHSVEEYKKTQLVDGSVEGFDYTVQYMVVPENATKEDSDKYYLLFS
nr:hypothetical protein [uncultured Butyrivibrio sp.]